MDTHEDCNERIERALTERDAALARAAKLEAELARVLLLAPLWPPSPAVDTTPAPGPDYMHMNLSLVDGQRVDAWVHMDDVPRLVCR